MGIKGLFKFLRKKDLIKDYQLNQLSCKRCAFDISSYIYKFKASDPKNWMKLLVNLLTTLKHNRIIIIVIFDGTAPCEKQDEQKKRKDRRIQNENKINKLKEATEEYMQTGVENEMLKEVKEKSKTEMEDIDDIVKYTEKLEKQNVNITSNDWNNVRKILQIFNISWVRAEGEAECMCSLMATRGNVDFVLSEDSDNLAYGCPILISKLDSYGKCECVMLHEVLDVLELTKQQFIDYCILCGTDYNKNINLISNVKALELIENYGSLDNLYIDKEFRQKIDTYIPNFVDIRHLFNPFEFKFVEGKVNAHFNSLIHEDKITFVTINNLENIDKKLDDLGCEYFPKSLSKINNKVSIQFG